MTPLFDASSVANTVNASSLSFNHAVITSVNPGLIIAITTGTSDSTNPDIVSSVTVGGVNATQAVKATTGAVGTRNATVYLYHFPAPVVGNNTILISVSKNTNMVIGAKGYSYSSYKPTGQVDVTGSNLATSSPESVSLTPIATGCWMVTAAAECTSADFPTPSASSGVTSRGTPGTYVEMGDSDAVVSGLTTQTWTFTGTQKDAIVGLTFKPSTSLSQTLSESLAMGALDTLTQISAVAQIFADSLAMATLDTIYTAYGWVNNVKTAVQSWFNNQKS